MKKSQASHEWIWAILAFTLVAFWVTAIIDVSRGSIGHADSVKKKGKVNINKCSNRELRKNVPGMTSDKAQRIIKGRPYSKIYDLVTKGVLTKKELSRVREYITAKDP